MHSPGASTLRVGIYFSGMHVVYFDMIEKKYPCIWARRALVLSGSHVLIFGMIKKIQAPACTLRVGIYFPGSHVLLFGMIKKKIRAPASNLRVFLLSGWAFTFRVGIYFLGRHLLSG